MGAGLPANASAHSTSHSRVNPLPQCFAFTFYIYQLVKTYSYQEVAEVVNFIHTSWGNQGMPSPPVM
ncbi:protein of unknown function [Pseudomonas sp. JV551A1]|uniref:Uncharacterized protein n=1 Tax=Pseudomonas inefficax TaxID=2078786 RepID=A0AAQ1P9Z8_9PSED|nr:protein of unknown function [Pseudomonas sp. JV551A1]SPO61231.1 protein of unknown function [Pseudomonas inefficax]